MSALQPPNLQQLKDTIVGNVSQRLSPAHFNTGKEQLAMHGRSSTQDSLPPERSTRVRTTTIETTATLPLTQSNIDANTRAAAELERRKERNRIHQARYKKRQTLHMTGLADSIRYLQEEIQELHLQHQLISLVSTSKSAWSVAAEYFSLFRFGVKTSSASMTQLHGAMETLCPFDPRVQHDFMLKTMAPDVTDGTVSGVSTIMERWEYMSLYCPGLEIELTCLESGDEDSVIATTKQNLTISESMLHITFPHLIQAGGEYSQLVNKLLGQQLVIQGSVNFEWDSTANRVASIVFKADQCCASWAIWRTYLACSITLSLRRNAGLLNR